MIVNPGDSLQWILNLLERTCLNTFGEYGGAPSEERCLLASSPAGNQSPIFRTVTKLVPRID
jgi:hypothetical protein